MSDHCGDCRLFRESPHQHMGSARCIRVGWVDADKPACKEFIPMPKLRIGTRVLWGRNATMRRP